MTKPYSRPAYALVYMVVVIGIVFGLLTLLLHIQGQAHVRAKDQAAIRQANYLAESGLAQGVWLADHTRTQAPLSYQEELAPGQVARCEGKLDASGLLLLEAEGRVERARAHRRSRGAWLVQKLLPDEEASIFFSELPGTVSVQNILLRQDPVKPGLILLAGGQTLLWPDQEVRTRDLYILSLGDGLPVINLQGTSHIQGTLALDGPLHVAGTLHCERLILRGPLTLDEGAGITCDELVLDPQYLPEEGGEGALEIGNHITTDPWTQTAYLPLYYDQT